MAAALLHFIDELPEPSDSGSVLSEGTGVLSVGLPIFDIDLGCTTQDLMELFCSEAAVEERAWDDGLEAFTHVTEI